MTKEELILIGYFPKIVAGSIFKPERNPEANWLKDVDRICSVSCCISKEPPDWMNKWKHNTTTWLYDNPEIALSVVPRQDLDKYTLFAYRILPYEFHRTGARAIHYNALTAKQIPHQFACIGYDVVNGNIGTDFGCSPLSCNGMAKEHRVNNHCLVDDFHTALELAGTFEIRNCEPGPYYVVEVWAPKQI